MRPPKLKHLVVIVLSVPLIAVLLWVAAVPESLIAKLIEGPAGQAGIGLDVSGLRKGLFFDIYADEVSANVSEKKIFSISDLSARANPLYLIILRLKFSFEGKAAGGEVAGTVYLETSGYEFYAAMDNVSLKGIEVFEAVGDGLLDADVRLKSGDGDARFSISDARFKEMSIEGASVPLNLFDRANGIVNIKGSLIEIGSLSLEGKGIYARLKGAVKGNDADLKLEVMPESGFMPDYLVSSVIGRYRVSPGYYVIPVKTKLSF